MKFSLFALALAVMPLALSAPAAAKNPHVMLETSQGTIELELFADKAPVSVENFLHYVQKGHYNGTIFHRVIQNFMIQGGGFDAKVSEKRGDKPPIRNEADNGLQNKRGTLAMARTAVVDSATTQFFINLVDNAFLDHKSKDMRGYGYAVFGKVVKGMEVVDRIGASKTGSCGPFRTDCPTVQVQIQKAYVVGQKAGAKTPAPKP